MEKVEDYKADSEIFENDIDMYLQIFCENQKPPIEDLTKASQSVWNAALMYVRRHVFKNREYFRNTENIQANNKAPISNYYIYNNLTDIPDSTIYDWGYNPQRQLSRVGSEIYKKLQKYNEESLENKLASGKVHPVGVIAILNRRHGWASPYTADSNRQRSQALTADQLPQLGQKDIVCLPEMDKNDNSTETN